MRDIILLRGKSNFAVNILVMFTDCKFRYSNVHYRHEVYHSTQQEQISFAQLLVNLKKYGEACLSQTSLGPAVVCWNRQVFGINAFKDVLHWYFT